MTTPSVDRTHHRSLLRWALRAALVIAAAFLLAACHQNGTEFVVDTTADTVDAAPGDGTCTDNSGSCSLRAAVMEANASAGVEEIVLAPGQTYTLTIPGTGEDGAATGDLDIAAGVVISGDATIDAAGSDRVLDITAPTGLVEVLGPDLVGGEAPDGAALRAAGGASVHVEHANISNNTASTGAPVSISAGKALLWSDTVHGNSGATSGGIHLTAGALDAQNLTLSGNTGDTGALRVEGGNADVRFSTITANTGVTAAITTTGGTTTLTASIAADQTTGPDCNGTTTSGGANLARATCALAGPGDRDADPWLGPLADNGGAVLTHEPRSPSPALDATGDCPAGNLDARDLPRPVGPACDTGAVELQVGPDCATPGPGADLRYCDLAGYDFTGIDLTGADLHGADITQAGLYYAASLQDVASGGLVGWPLDYNGCRDAPGCTPWTLPAGWLLANGYLAGPGADLAGADLRGAFSLDLCYYYLGFVCLDLSGADVRSADLSENQLTGATLTGADLTGTNLTGTNLTNADLGSIDLTGATLTRVRSGGIVGTPTALPTNWILTGGYLIGPGADLTDADLTGIDLTSADLTGANLTGVHSGGITGTPTALPTNWILTGGYLIGPGADLAGADLAGLDLAGLDLTGADLDAADLTGAALAGARLRSVSAGGAAIDRADLTGADLTNSRLSDATLTDTRLQTANLSRANLWYADLTRADLRGASLADASLVNASLPDADFEGATLDGVSSAGITGSPARLPGPWMLRGGYLIGPYAELSWATLSGLDLSGGSLYGADLLGANAIDTDFTGTTLDQADVYLVRWSNTTCPDGANSDDIGGTCAGHLLP